MSNETRVGIFGSCVSRDMCELWSGATPAVYVARQSAIVTLNPMGSYAPSGKKLESDFQRRAFRGDVQANVVQRLTDQAVDVVVIDLVDERRGVWVDADGHFLTNSIEAFKLGIDEIARKENLRLIEFGSDEHFELWKQGFVKIIDRLRQLGKPIVLLDIAWADTFDDERWSSPQRRALGRLLRTGRRNYRQARRYFQLGRPLWSVAVQAVNRTPVEVDERRVEVAKANALLTRYIDFARHYVDHVVTRGEGEVRSSRTHKWGEAPFHYDDVTYRGIVREIEGLIAR